MFCRWPTFPPISEGVIGAGCSSPTLTPLPGGNRPQALVVAFAAKDHRGSLRCRRRLPMASGRNCARRWRPAATASSTRTTASRTMPALGSVSAACLLEPQPSDLAFQGRLGLLISGRSAAASTVKVRRSEGLSNSSRGPALLPALRRPVLRGAGAGDSALVHPLRRHRPAGGATHRIGPLAARLRPHHHPPGGDRPVGRAGPAQRRHLANQVSHEANLTHEASLTERGPPTLRLPSGRID